MTDMNYTQIDYWTPAFDQDLQLIEGSLPTNRKGKAFEIRGMTIPYGYISGFQVTNGYVALFGNSSQLLEIMGVNNNPLNGGDFGGFAETWTPGLLPGANITFTNVLDLGMATGHSAVLSEDSLSVSYQVEDIATWTLQTAAHTADVLDFSGVGQKGIYFKMPDPSNMDGAFYITLTNGFNYPETAPTAMVAVIISGGGTGEGAVPTGMLRVNSIGDVNIDDYSWYGEAIDADGPTILIEWTPELEFCLAFDVSEGAYGTLYLYASTAVDNISNPTPPVASHTLTTDRDPLTRFMAQIVVGAESGLLEGTFTLVNNPAYPRALVENMSGGLFDENSYPEDPAGKAYNITGMDGVVAHPTKGILMNGDLVFFNANGDLAGTMLSRANLADAGVDLNQVQSMLTNAKSGIGELVWSPVSTTEFPTLGFTGHLAENTITVDSAYSHSLDAIEYPPNGQYGYDIIGYTGHLFTATPSGARNGGNWEGILFRLPNPSYFMYLTGNAHLMIGFSDDDYNGNPTLLGNNRAMLRINITGGLSTYPSQSDPAGLYHTNDGLGPGAAETQSQLTWNENIPLNSSDTYFLGFNGNQFMFRNATAGEDMILTFTNPMNQNRNKRFFFAFTSDQTSAMTPIDAVLVNLAGIDDAIFFTQGVNTGIINIDDEGALPYNRHNKSFEVSLQADLLAPYGSTLGVSSIGDGDIAVFNSQGNLIRVFSVDGGQG